MTISSSMNAGVMGLTVNATRLASISDNIANSSTNGYKRTEVDFSSLVLNQSSAVYTAGGVRVTTGKEISAQGALISTGSSTDIAVNGSGMIPVTTIQGATESADEREFRMVPTGSFAPDSRGNLRTPSGLYLLGWPVDSAGEAITGARDSAAGLVPVNIDVTQLSATPTARLSLGLNLPAYSTDAGSTGEAYTLPVEYYDNLGGTESLTYTFTPVVPATGSSNSWTVSIEDSAGAPGNSVGTFAVSFDTSAANGGSITNITAGGGASYDPVTGELSFNVAGGPMTSFIGREGESDGMTQLSAPFAPLNVSKDGAPIGELQAVEFTQDGVLEAIFSSGSRRALYQIPIVDVPNVDGLQAADAQSYTVSQESGGIYLWNAGSGPTGGIESYALMESNTDIAGELTNLIETQRAYSSNAKIIQTVDEMLQETTNLKR